jgi:hypothetical protein
MTGSLFRSTFAHSGTTLSIVSKEYSELKTRTCTEIHDKQAVCSVPVKWLMVPQLSLLSNHKEYSIALALDQADDCIGKEYSNVCGRERTLEWNAGSSFRFYTQEYVTPFLGPVTDGKALSGSWKNPEPPDENSNCSLGDNSNLTVEWSAARQ